MKTHTAGDIWSSTSKFPKKLRRTNYYSGNNLGKPWCIMSTHHGYDAEYLRK